MKMLKSKNIRRICVLLAMLAPVVYLFGSLFAGLAGAHGTQLWAQDDISSDVLISSDTFILGRLPSGVYPVLNPNSYNSWATHYFEADSPFTVVNQSSVFPSSARMRLYVYNDDNEQVEMFDQYGDSDIFYDGSSTRFAVVYSSILDGADHVSDLSTLVVFNDIPDLNSGISYADFTFGQFFYKDNFLVKIGEDVLSENPHGFVPFASFWKYLDTNMLHMGDMQLGLMGYGYVYYCCHVLLFDIAFILVTFFLDFIQKVNDKVVGGVD